MGPRCADVCVCVCVPVAQSRLQGRAVSFESSHCGADLFRLDSPSLQSCGQPFVFELQPLNVPETKLLYFHLSTFYRIFFINTELCQPVEQIKYEITLMLLHVSFHD